MKEVFNKMDCQLLKQRLI